MMSLRLCIFSKNTTEAMLCPHIAGVHDVDNLLLLEILASITWVSRCLPSFSSSEVTIFPFVIDKYLREIL